MKTCVSMLHSDSPISTRPDASTNISRCDPLQQCFCADSPFDQYRPTCRLPPHLLQPINTLSHFLPLQHPPRPPLASQYTITSPNARASPSNVHFFNRSVPSLRHLSGARLPMLSLTSPSALWSVEDRGKNWANGVRKPW